MHRKERDEHAWECDGCGDTSYGGSLEFHEGWAELKSLGWTARKTDGEWEHFCPSCSRDEPVA